MAQERPKVSIYELDDWAAVYIDGVLYWEHHASNMDVVDILRKVGVSTDHRWIDEAEWNALKANSTNEETRKGRIAHRLEEDLLEDLAQSDAKTRAQKANALRRQADALLAEAKELEAD